MMTRFDVPAGTTLRIPFCSYDANGASVALGESPAVGDINIYKDGSTTERSSTAGTALTDTNFDGITGLNALSIDLADNTDSGFYAVGSEYWVVVQQVSVDSQDVTFIAAWFRIIAAETSAGTAKADVSHWLGTAAATPTVSGVPEVDVTHWIGTAAATPTVAGVPEVDVTHWIGTAAATPTTAGVPEVDVTFIAGSAVSTSSAQIGVNVVNAGGTAWASGSLTSGVFASGAITATAIATDAIGADEIADGAITAATFAAGAIDATAIANDAIDAATLAADVATEIATGVWASGTRSLTILDEDSTTIDIDNSVWGGGTRTLTALDEDTTTLDLDATIRGAVGLASANLDTQLDALPTAAENATAVWGAGTKTLTAIDEDNTTLDLDATIRAAVGLASANLDTQIAALPTAGENADAIHDEVVEGSYTFRELVRGMVAALLGKASGLGTSTAVFKNTGDDVDVITATVDADGNRSAVTLDLDDTP